MTSELRRVYLISGIATQVVLVVTIGSFCIFDFRKTVAFILLAMILTLIAAGAYLIKQFDYNWLTRLVFTAAWGAAVLTLWCYVFSRDQWSIVDVVTGHEKPVEADYNIQR